jgi:hypothetical protein
MRFFIAILAAAYISGCSLSKSPAPRNDAPPSQIPGLEDLLKEAKQSADGRLFTTAESARFFTAYNTLSTSAEPDRTKRNIMFNFLKVEAEKLDGIVPPATSAPVDSTPWLQQEMRNDLITIAVAIAAESMSRTEVTDIYNALRYVVVQSTDSSLKEKFTLVDAIADATEPGNPVRIVDASVTSSQIVKEMSTSTPKIVEAATREAIAAASAVTISSGSTSVMTKSYIDMHKKASSAEDKTTTKAILNELASPNTSVQEKGDIDAVIANSVQTGSINFSYIKNLTAIASSANRPPLPATVSKTNIDENIVAGSLVGIISSTDPDGDTIAYSLVEGAGSADNAFFSIQGNSLFIGISPNYEAKPSYSLVIKSTDTFGLSATSSIVISVNDKNEIPTDITLSSGSVDENTVNSVIGSLSATDPDSNESFTFEIAGGDAPSLFSISGSTLTLVGPLDYEAKSLYSLLVKATDSEELSLTKEIIITVNDKNDAPSSISLSSSSINENSSNLSVGTLSAEDQDSGDAITFSIAGGTDSASFEISSATLMLKTQADYETKSSYDVTVRAQDSQGLYFDKDLNITVININEAPLTISLSKLEVEENAGANTEIGTLSATDPDNNSLTFSVSSGVDEEAFSISNNKLFLKSSADYESKPSYDITIRATDTSGLWSEGEFTIIVRDLNDLPTNISLSSSTISEMNNQQSFVGLLAAADQDSAENHLFSIISVDGVPVPQENSLFFLEQNALYTNFVSNYEQKSSYSVVVRVVDKGGASFEKALIVSVVDENDPPTDITLSTLTVEENNDYGIEIGILSATDSDVGDIHTYQLASGGSSDNDFFEIQGNRLILNSVANYEERPTLSVRVQARDRGGLSIDKLLSIEVLNVNEAPAGVELSSYSIVENNETGEEVGTLAASDPDGSDAGGFVFELPAGAAGNDNGLFTIVGNSLRLQTRADFEQKSYYSVLVRVTDSGGLSVDSTLFINVDPENEAATEISLSNNQVEENTQNSLVGTFSSNDPEGDVLTYSLEDGPGDTGNNRFSISNGQLYLVGTADYETEGVLSIRVRGSDQGGASVSKNLIIYVVNVYEAQVYISNEQILSSGFYTGNLVGYLQTDSQRHYHYANEPHYTYALVPGEGSEDNHIFSIAMGSFGLWNSWQETPETVFYSYLRLGTVTQGDKKSSYKIRIRSTDSAGRMVESKINLSLVESSSVYYIESSDLILSENNTPGSDIGALRMTASAGSNPFSFSLVEGEGSSDNSNFVIFGDRVIAQSSADFESKSQYLIRVRAQDNQGTVYEEAKVVGVRNVNEAPTALALGPSSITENNNIGDRIGTLSTTDEDQHPVNSFRYSLVSGAGSNDNDKFEIVSVPSGGFALAIKVVANFSIKNQYSVRLRTTDVGSLFFETVLTINIEQTNTPPTAINLSLNSLSENNSSDFLVGRFSTIDSQTTAPFLFSYSLVFGDGSLDNERFYISNDGLYIRNAADYETKSEYYIRVASNDPGSLSFERSFIIFVTDAPDAPTGISLTSVPVLENTTTDVFAGSFTTQDPDTGDSHTYELVSGPGGEQSHFFRIVGNELFLEDPADFETRNRMAVRVRATDQTGLFRDQSFFIDVIDIQEGPTSLVLTPSSLNENNTPGSLVGVFTSIDPEGSPSFTYELVSGEGDTDNAAFLVSGDRLYINSTADFEVKNSFSIRVKTTAADNLSFSRSIIINVNNLNESPVGLSLTENRINENNLANSIVGILSTQDPDSQNSFTYSLETGEGSEDNAAFSIHNNFLRISVASNFEEKESYRIRIRTTDQGGLSTETAFTVEINDVNEAPSDIALDSTTVNENDDVNVQVGSLSTQDPDAGNAFSYSLVSGAGSVDNPSFYIAGGSLYLKEVANYEQKESYYIRIRSSDQNLLSFEEAFVINVVNRPEPPTNIVLASAGSINENNEIGAELGALITTDPDSHSSYEYELVPGDGSQDNSSFSISGDKLIINISANFESKSSFSVRIRTTDPDELFYERALLVHISNVNEAPNGLSLNNDSFNENNAPNAAIGLLVAADQDLGDSFSYQLVEGEGDADNDSFFLSGAVLSLISSSNFEERSSYSVRVRVTDAGGLWFERSLAIGVNDVNEAPTLLSLDRTDFDENNEAGVVVGYLSSADPDSNAVLTYAFSSDLGPLDNAAFSIVGNALKFNSQADFETKSSFSIRVLVRDQGLLSLDKTFTITVNDRQEPPTDIILSSSSLNENNVPGIQVGSLSTLDTDGPSPYVYQLVSGQGGSDNSAFSVSGDSLILETSANFEAKSYYSIRLRTTANDGLFFEKEFTITINDLNERPTLSDITDKFTDEDTNAFFAVNVNDDDGTLNCNSSLFVASMNTELIPAASISIVGASPVCFVTITPALNKYGSAVLTLIASDGILSSESRTLNLTVVSVNDRPSLVGGGDSVFNINEDTAGTISLDSGADIEVSTEGQTLSFQLVSSPTRGTLGSFPVNASLNGGNIQYTPNSNYVGPDSFSYRICDDFSTPLCSNIKTVSIQVQPVNDAPTNISLSQTAVMENSVQNALVGNISVSDPDIGDVFSYSLSGVDADDFYTSSEGGLFLKQPARFEVKPSYSVTIRATDSGALFVDKQFTITVNNVNDAPTISLASAEYFMNEDWLIDIPVNIGDADGPLVCSSALSAISSNTSIVTNQGAVFSVSGSFPNCIVRVIPNVNRNGSLTITVSVSDGLASQSAAYSLVIFPVNDTPVVFTQGASTATVKQASTTSVSLDIGSDIDIETNSQALRYVLETSPTKGTLGAFPTRADVSGSVVYTPNAGAQSLGSDSFSYKICDDNVTPACTSVKTVSVTVQEANAAPTDIVLSSNSINENNQAGAVIGSFSSVDPDEGNTFTYALVSGSGSTDNGSFSLQGNNLVLSPVADFETKSSYSVRVRSTDQGALWYEEIITINILNVNEAPTAMTTGLINANENNSAGIILHYLSTSDPDAGNTFSYSLVDGTGASDNSSFSIVNNELRLNVITDYETKNSYSVRLRSTDQGGLWIESQISVNVIDFNEAQTDIVLTPAFFTENIAYNSIVGILSSVDPDAGASFTYSKVAGVGDTDNACFNIIVIGGLPELRFLCAADFETKNTYSVRIRSRDTQSPNFTFEKALTISVLNGNDAPTNITLSNSSIAENSAVDTAVGTFTSTDIDPGNTFTYSLVAGTGDTDNNSFNISGAELRMSITANLEAKGSYSVRVRTTDQGGLSFDKAFTVTITNVNEPPTNILLTNSTIAENSSIYIGNGFYSTVGTLSSVDPDSGSSFSYSLPAGVNDNDSFEPFFISSNQLRLKGSADFETKQSYIVTVRTTDNGGLTFDKQFTITVTNVNEAPTISSLVDTTVLKDSGSVIQQTFVIGDVDSSLNCSSSLTAASSNSAVLLVSGITFGGSAPNCTVTLNPVSGQSGTSTVTITVSDGALSASSSMTLTVMDTTLVSQTVGAEGQRRSFFDSATNRHWEFVVYQSGSTVVTDVRNSSNGSSWSPVTTISGVFNDVTVTAKNGHVFIVDSNGSQVRVRRGVLGAGTLTLESPVTVLTASAGQEYLSPSATILGSGQLMIAVRDANSSGAVAAVRMTTSDAIMDLASWGSTTNLGARGSIKAISVLPRSNSNSDAFLLVQRDALEAYSFTSGSWSLQTSGGVTRWLPVSGSVGFNGAVLASVIYRGELVLGGSFTTADSTHISYIAKWDGASFSPLGGGTFNGSVNALAVSPNGLLYAGGAFTSAGGVSANRIASWNGSSWAALGDGLSSTVSALAVNSSGLLYAGGAFTTTGGVTPITVNRIASWNGTTWAALGSGFDNNVNAMAVSSTGLLYAGGAFLNANGAAANRVASWNGTTWSALGSGVGGAVNALAISSTGTLFVGGFFSTAGGFAATNLARWSGTSWSSAGSGLNAGQVNTLSFNSSGVLYIGGAFSSMLATLNGTTTTHFTGISGTALNTVSIDTAGKVYVGGTFSSLNSSVAPGNFAIWSNNTWSSRGSGVRAASTATIHAMAYDSLGNLYVGGEFTSIGGVGATNIARWNGSSWSALGSNGSWSLSSSVRAIATDSSGNVYVGGSFTQLNAVNANRVARWDGTSWSALGTGTNNTVFSLAVNGTTLYAGGTFSQAGGVTRNGIAAWDTVGSTWSTLTGGPGTGASIFALHIFSGRLYAGGTSSSAAAFIASMNLTDSTWSQLTHTGGTHGVSSSSSPSVQSLTNDGTRLIVGGKFNTAGGIVSVSNIASYNPSTTTWAALGSGLGVANSDSVHSLAASGSTVYATGSFTTAGGSASNVASNMSIWNGSAWVAPVLALTPPMSISGKVASTTGNRVVFGNGRHILEQRSVSSAAWLSSAAADVFNGNIHLTTLSDTGAVGYQRWLSGSSTWTASQSVGSSAALNRVGIVYNSVQGRGSVLFVDSSNNLLRRDINSGGTLGASSSSISSSWLGTYVPAESGNGDVFTVIGRDANWLIKRGVLTVVGP